MKGKTMSRFFYFCIAIFLVVIFGCNEKDINGKWKGEMQTPNGPFELTYDFKVIGDSLAGTVTSQMGTLPLSNGKVKGEDMFSFDVDVNGMTFSQQCTVMGDSISMKVQGMQGPVEMILKRVPESNGESM
jgi:hypothetical protein